MAAEALLLPFFSAITKSNRESLKNEMTCALTVHFPYMSSKREKVEKDVEKLERQIERKDKERGLKLEKDLDKLDRTRQQGINY